MVDILKVINELDEDNLHAQGWLIDTLITNLESEYQEAITEEEAEKITEEINLLKNLLNLIENLAEFCMQERLDKFR